MFITHVRSKHGGTPFLISVNKPSVIYAGTVWQMDTGTKKKKKRQKERKNAENRLIWRYFLSPAGLGDRE